jgi:hypothetical protein
MRAGMRGAPMSDPSPSSLAPSATDALRRRKRARTALCNLVRSELAQSWGVRVATGLCWFIAAGALASVMLIARGNTPDDAVLAILAQAAAVTAVIGGGLAGLTLSARPKSSELSLSLRALAIAHGLGDTELARAELVATCRILAAITALPVAALALFIVTVVGRAHPGRWMFTVAGTILFSGFSAVVLGALASVCRQWTIRGRRWFLGATLLPWILAPVVFGEHPGDWLSVPGVLAQVWHALATVPT